MAVVNNYAHVNFCSCRKMFIVCVQHKLYKTMRKVPLSLEGVLDEETFEKARLYQLDRSQFGFWAGLYSQLELTVSYWLHITE